MELIVIGAGPAYTDRRGAAAASFLVSAQGAALLLDLGQGAFPNLASTMEPSELAAVVVSHLHPDHFVDLVPLRHYLKWEFDPPRRAQVIGPAGLADRLDGLDGQPGFSAVSLMLLPVLLSTSAAVAVLSSRTKTAPSSASCNSTRRDRRGAARRGRWRRGSGPARRSRPHRLPLPAPGRSSSLHRARRGARHAGPAAGGG